MPVLHRCPTVPEAGSKLFNPTSRLRWLSQAGSTQERARNQSEWATLIFGEEQKQLLETCLAEEAARGERVPLLVQLPGISLSHALTVLAAIATSSASRKPGNGSAMPVSALG